MSNENDEQNRAEVDLRTPDVWCVELGVQILDADGWRGRDGRDWADPISLAEFQQRLATCTQRSTAPRDQHQKWADPQGLIVETQPAGEHHTGTLDLTGEGNAPANPIPPAAVTALATSLAWSASWDTYSEVTQQTLIACALPQALAALEAAYPAIRQQVAEEIAVAIERVAAEDHGGDAYINADRAATIAREIGGVA